MEDFVKQSLLYDFYGDLLTDHQKDVYGAYVQENFSLSEIAEDAGISRQAAFDMVKRCKAILEGYEEKLRLVEKFLKIREMAGRIQEASSLEEAKNISEKITDLL